MKWLEKGRFSFFQRQAGFSLIEVLVAVAIMAAIGVGFLTVLNTNSRATRALDEQVTAVNLAAAYLETIRALPYADTYPNAEDTITVPFQYSVVPDYAYSGNGTDWVDFYTDENLERITVIISREGKYILSICTYRSER